MAAPESVDYYELLMISPRADRAMVEWSVRLMLRRYGPENKATGDVEKYSLVQQAFRTLADSEKRAEYDETYGLDTESTPSEDTADNSKNGHAPKPNALSLLKPAPLRSSVTREHVLTQQQIRQGIISVVYDAMAQRSRNPELGRAEIVRVLGRSNDELEFALWLLREEKLIRTTPNGAYSATAKGVRWAEDGGVPNLSADERDDGSAAQSRKEGAKSDMPLPNDTVSRA